ncbi:MAG TPA: hypothetical protein VKU91_03610, partial [Acidimicrobiales bacterium]|nr:hypothetical protein [Acidimicrobiales bacterium]
GKVSKLAAGVLMTHYRRSRVDTALLAEVARLTGAPAAVVSSAPETATARHFAEACADAGSWEPLAELCRRASRNCSQYAGGLPVEVIMVDFDGHQVWARG